MLTQPTIEKLHALHLAAMAQAFEMPRGSAAHAELRSEGRFGLLVDAEWTAREQRRLAQLIASHLPPTAWHAAIGEPSVADAICDRPIYRAHKLTLKGPTMRDPETRQPMDRARPVENAQNAVSHTLHRRNHLLSDDQNEQAVRYPGIPALHLIRFGGHRRR
jgi:hypothetical protein